MSVFAIAGADISVKDPELVVPKVAVESASDIQVAKAQVGTPQTIQRIESSLILES